MSLAINRLAISASRLAQGRRMQDDDYTARLRCVLRVR